MRSIQEFLNAYSELNEQQDDADDMEEAGAYLLEAMGAYAVILPIAEQYGWSMEYILQSEAETVYNILLYQHRKNKFQRNLAEIKRRGEELRRRMHDTD